MSEQPIRRLGVMGGTFDPIHIGHLVAASEAVHQLSLDLVLFVVAGDPWQRSASSSPEDRLLMVALAVESHAQMAVSRMEIDRPGPTYTVDTLRQLRDFYQGAEVFFIAGTDAIALLPTWHEFSALRELAQFAVVTRDGTSLDDVAPMRDGPQLNPISIPEIGISGTEIRARVREGRPIDFLVPDPVALYIRERGLYVGQTEMEDV